MASPPLEATPPLAHIAYYILYLCTTHNTLNSPHFIKYVLKRDCRLLPFRFSHRAGDSSKGTVTVTERIQREQEAITPH